MEGGKGSVCQCQCQCQVIVLILLFSSDSIFYSVLVKSNGKGGIQEVYRVRLPGNPVIGEGKVSERSEAKRASLDEDENTRDESREMKWLQT